jgi:mannose-6-phosphate isomerase-like protein (cupin superfamily)
MQLESIALKRCPFGWSSIAKEQNMAGPYVVKSATAPAGSLGQIHLASGQRLSMRLWRDEEPHRKAAVRRDYETLGYVISGTAELIIEGETMLLVPGDSWVVPAGSQHAYHITASFTAVEATAPPTHETSAHSNAEVAEEAAMDDDRLAKAVARLRGDIATERERLGALTDKEQLDRQTEVAEKASKLARYEAEQIKRASDFGK